MKDTILAARLENLGMPPRRADRVAAMIRDHVHPVAAIASAKAANVLSGYDEPGMGKFSLKKVAKKVGKVVKKVAKVAVPLVTSVGGAYLGLKLGQSVVKSITKKKPKSVAQLSTQLAQGGAVTVPTQYADAGAALATQALDAGQTYDTSALMNSMLAAGGVRMESPQAQQLLSDVAQQGVEPTPGGPQPLPSWVLPASIAAAGLVVVMAMRSRSRR